MNVNELRFLVIDDDSMTRTTVIDFLKSNSCEHITECHNGAEGLEIIKNQPIDFVICDWEMPVMDGLELVKRLRSMVEYAELPFMMITSPIRNENIKIEDAGQSGVDAYLIKPFRSRMLLQKIKEVLDDKIQKNKKAIVLADDDDMVRDYVAEVLKGMGYDPVFQFAKASDAYHFLEKNFQKIVLVISDWEMPEMTGIEFLHKIRINRQLSEMPFIMITSQTSVEHLKVQKAIQADVDNYLMKPFSVETLQTKIKLVLTQVKVDLTTKRALENAAAAMADADLVDAEKYYQHAIALNPKNPEGSIGLGNVELKRSRFEEAVKHFREAIAINPKVERPHIELALAYEGAMALDKATTCLREALNWCSPQDHVYYHLGRLLHRRGKNDEAKAHLEKALELNPRMDEAKELLKTLTKEK